MNKILSTFALAGLMAAGTAQAVDVTGNVSFSQDLNLVNPGLQVRALVLSNAGPQAFVPLSFDATGLLNNVGDSFTFDVFVVRTLETSVEADDLIFKPFSLLFDLNVGDATITGNTYAVNDAGSNSSYGFIDFAGPVSIALGGGQFLDIALSDASYNVGSPLGTLTPGKPAGAVVSVTLSVSAVPEPTNLALALLGFAGLGTAAWRQRSASRRTVAA